jgi:hypothetical protein
VIRARSVRESHDVDRQQAWDLVGAAIEALRAPIPNGGEIAALIGWQRRTPKKFAPIE